MEDNIPPEIGPHEGRELELMLAGEKPAAMFSDAIPASYDFGEADFASHVATGRILFKEDFHPPTSRSPLPGRYVYYALPHEAWRIDRLIEIHHHIHLDGNRTTPQLEAEIGRLLGYAETHIQKYLKRFFGA